ncbi:citrate lyase holo-[acyl-carrier protein] synthase [Streptococcus dentasini]
MSEKLSIERVFDGPQVGLEDMLAAREDRSRKQTELLKTYKSHSLLCATMNIPGPIKTSQVLNQAFTQLVEHLQQEKSSLEAVYEELRTSVTGWEYYLVSNLEPEQLKQRMVALEIQLPIGRLLDLDVLSLQTNRAQAVSRTELGLPTRSCYICREDAKICGRSRKHSIQEVQNAIVNLLN